MRVAGGSDPSRHDLRGLPARRYGLLTGACALATLANPYGWRLHQHLVRYLTSSWIRQVVEEFQSPRFRSESMLQFEILLFVGPRADLRALPRAARTRSAADRLLGARGAGFGAPCAAVRNRRRSDMCRGGQPAVVTLERRLQPPFRSLGLLRDCLRDFSAAPARTSLWVPVVLLCLCFVPWDGPRDFPANKFPVAAVDRNRSVIAPAHRAPAAHPDLRSMGRLPHLSPLSGRAGVCGRPQRLLWPRNRP